MVDVTGIGENTLLQALLGQHATVSDEECALLKEKCSHILREELNSVIEQVILELSTAASSRGS